MVAPNGVVHGLEYLKELSRWSESNLRKSFADLLDSHKITIHRLSTFFFFLFFSVLMDPRSQTQTDGDGWLGLAEHGPFDVIHVGAAAESGKRTATTNDGRAKRH